MEEVIKLYFMAASLVSQKQIFHNFVILDFEGFSIS